MNIHPLWFICICIRLLIIYIIRHINNKTNSYNSIISIILFIIGFGFIYKCYFSSNNEIQIAKVFWHDKTISTRKILIILPKIFVVILNCLFIIFLSLCLITNFLNKLQGLSDT